MKIISVPFSGGGLGHGSGANFAPEKIVSALDNCFANEDGFSPVFSFDKVLVDESNIQTSHDNIFNKLKTLNDKAIILGGDHSITFPCVKAFADSNNFSKDDFFFIVFDAHPDLMDDFVPPSQEDYLRVLVEQNIINPNNIILFGLRNWDKKEIDYLKEKNISHFTCKEIFDKGIKQTIKEVYNKINDVGKPVYLSIDIDVVDPVEAIGTGYIEHGGISSRELIYSLQHIKKSNLIKMVDLVEVNPKKDVNNITSVLAAKVVVELSNF